MIATVRRPVAGAVGESASAATHGRIESRRSAIGDSSATWRSSRAKTARASSWSPWPKTAARISYQPSAPTPGGSSWTSVRISCSVRSGAVARPARTCSRGALRAHSARARRSRLRRLSTDDVQLRPVLEPEPVAVREVLVDGGTAAGPLVVVVEHDRSAGHEQRRDPLQAGHRRLVPVAVEVREGDRLVEHDRVLEQPADQLDVVLLERDAEPSERLADLAVEVVAVSVVRVAADAARVAGRDLRVALVDVGAVVLARRGDHAEDVVDLHRPLGRLRGGEHDRRAAARGAGLDHEAGQAVALDPSHDARQLAQVAGLEVRQVLGARLGDRALDLRREPGGELRARLAQLPARLAELAPGGPQLGFQLGLARPAQQARDGAASLARVHRDRRSLRGSRPAQARQSSGARPPLSRRRRYVEAGRNRGGKWTRTAAANSAARVSPSAEKPPRASASPPTAAPSR